MRSLRIEDQTVRIVRDTMTGGMKDCQSIVNIIQREVQGSLTGLSNSDVGEMLAVPVDIKLDGHGLMIQDEWKSLLMEEDGV